MRAYDIIDKKKRGEELSAEEIKFFTRGYLSGEIPDYQVSALLMAICLKGMTTAETVSLTEEITSSGDSLDLSMLGDRTVDKHSTGGVGDKTTLVIAPIVAASGGVVAKMSGRGLGHTGGTVDKLESFPGFRTTLTEGEFIEQTKKIALAVVGQSGELAPLDKKLYALRDVTATVDSIPLIASSIMGKKLACGSRSIVLDVKYGSGAFMKDAESAYALGKLMVDIGRARGRNMAALITDMDTPLGRAVGNIPEVKEAIALLSGEDIPDLYEVCISLAAAMLSLSLGIDEPDAAQRCREAVESGRALAKLEEWISAQGGDGSCVRDVSRLPRAKREHIVYSVSEGYVEKMNAEKIGLVCCSLGAGRRSKDDGIDYTAGLTMLKKTGEYVKEGEPLAILYTSGDADLEILEREYIGALVIGDKPKKNPLIAGRII
ncbi:MAG: thymidine phosphorylase [Clostridia bacterium]|nr:thymidine phosphorylase [Clostridia bacterium]